ncbi:ubiquitin-like domain-containing protein CIP73 isoform X2 [Rhododendron vialii]|uniref:ubiquitin-like domain-containing protein CIP73 isoform X2 n=1 Tax=Rhododendron vialii TaxID=182163 RepID=UPI0026602062|nr:ubiquitin-like domain-containing protein CIP73 isoform X2 [Rhododendron vialii]XP_058203334.1 ubiquitin-like domain-containing protein CIP73 isoform X2 [Rhododendron vialii]
MGSNGCDEVMISGSNECSEATVEIEIKIKTLDSQTYTLRVDKCVPIPALKEQIATVTGVLSEQQRLICRGKVLKDDQLLSAYHVEDGHTLHMVVRQPMLPPLGSTDHPGTDPASSSSQGNQGGPSVVLGSFNISEQGDGVLPDFGRIVSAVLGSFGITNFGSGNEGADLREAAPEGLSRIPFGGLRNSNGQQTDQPASRGQSDPRNVASSFATSVPLEDLHPPVIPDSVTTLSQYLTRMRQEFSGNVRGQSNNSQAAGTGQDYDAAIRSAAGRGGLPTPASLAEVMLSTRQILTDQAADCLSQLTRQLEDQANMTDPLARTSIQSNAMRSGVLLQNLGALLLELGRTTMTLRMGQTPGDAVVNAGPAVFISTSGPNPIMVQPLPFQPGTSFGAIPMGAAQPGLGSLGSGFLPRNIDIRIRTGPLIPPPNANQRDSAGAQQSPVQSNLSTSGDGSSIHQAASGLQSSTREPQVRVVPIRTVVAAVPASVRRSPSDSSHGSVGLLYPVIARVQHLGSGNLNNLSSSQVPDERLSAGVESRQQRHPDSAAPLHNIGIPGVDANAPGDATQNGQGYSTQIPSGLDQLLRSIFPGVGNISFQRMDTSSAAGHMGPSQGTTTTQEAAPGEAAPRAGDEGIFLSNLLRQIMPIISQNTEIRSSSAPPEAGSETMDTTIRASSTQAQENSDRGTLSDRRGDPPSPSSKRQRRE